MFIYLNKKIAIPHNIALSTLSWNASQGWIACGGENGLLKVLKLDARQSRSSIKAQELTGETSQSQLQMNQTLEGHSGTILCAVWNENYRKLTTSDSNGLIIVWCLHKQSWFEEMINNRNKSVVRAMKWNGDGTRICIVYEDGAVIVGSVDGNRIWGKDLQDTQLMAVEWSPDGRNILFGTLSDEVHLYDALGNFITKLNIYAHTPGAKLRSVEWYIHGASSVTATQLSNGGQSGMERTVHPCLAIAFDNGRVQINRDDVDDEPILIDSQMQLHSVKWNSSGSVLAISGTKHEGSSTAAVKSNSKEMIQFYTPYGKHLRTLVVPGSGVKSLSWEGGSLRLALAVDSYIYFANLRPDYEWGFFASNVLVYAFTRPERVEHCVCFYDTLNDCKHIKYVKSLMSVCTASARTSDLCCFTTRTDDGSGQFILILCNAIGSPIDSKYIDVEPVCITMNETYVVVTNGSQVYVWQYKQLAVAAPSATNVSQSVSKSALSIVQRSATGLAAANKGLTAADSFSGKERLFHVDEPQYLEHGQQESLSAMLTHVQSMQDSSDPITACTLQSTQTGQSQAPSGATTIAGSSASTAVAAVYTTGAPATHVLILARSSGVLLRFALNQLKYDTTPYSVSCRPQLLALNCNCTRMTIIDIKGILILYDFEQKSDAAASPHPGMTLPGVERKDAWHMVWSSDSPTLWACMEKTRQYVFRDTAAEEPVMSHNYLAKFDALCITSVGMDDIMFDLELIDSPDKDCLILFETKALRDTRQLLAHSPLDECYTFVLQNSHPRLWQLLAETSLSQLDFVMAEKAFVRCRDYQGIQFIKRLKLLADDKAQKAEVLAYFRHFDEAEQILLSIDSKEAAVKLRCRLGDWFRVVQLIQSGAGNDSLLHESFNHIGSYYADRLRWTKALKFYTKAGNLSQMIHSAYLLDDYDELTRLIDVCSRDANQHELQQLAEMFRSVGLCAEAVKAYCKAGQVQSAIDSAIQLNQWDQAIQLAQQSSQQGGAGAGTGGGIRTSIDELLTRYAAYLLSQHKLCQAIDLYRKAHRNKEASRFLHQLALQPNSATAALLQTQQQSATDAKLRGQSVSAALATLTQSSNNSNNASAVAQNLVRTKKLLVLAAVEADRARLHAHPAAKQGSLGGGSSTEDALQQLDRLLDSNAPIAASLNAVPGSTQVSTWHAAEAYHYLLLAHRALYSSQVELALRASVRLTDYEDVLPVLQIYSLLCLSAYLAQQYRVASRALIKLENEWLRNQASSSDASVSGSGSGSMLKSSLLSRTAGGGMSSGVPNASGVGTQVVNPYQKLALAIFTLHAPVDQKPAKQQQCGAPIVNQGQARGAKASAAQQRCTAMISDADTSCAECGRTWAACTLSARSLLNVSDAQVVVCRCCKHKSVTTEVEKVRLVNCPLCHSPLR